MSFGSEWTRREWLKTLPLVGALAACQRTSPFRASDFVVPPRSAVGLFAAPTYAVDFADIIGRGLRELGADVRGRSVLLKPNLVEFAPGTAINTHPAVVAGAAIACLRGGARAVVVAEGPGHRRDIEYLISASTLDVHLRDAGVSFVDLNHDDVRMVPLRSRFTGLDAIALPATLLDADFVVSMPKLKTHHWAAMTCSMKNLFGVVPGAIYGWPKNVLHAKGIDASILDLTATVRPHFAIVDAVVAMEGRGPIMGTPRQTGFLAMGSDLVAVDATCARLIGLDPIKIPYLAEAGRFLGRTEDGRIDQRGEPLGRYRTRFHILPEFASMLRGAGA